MTKTNLITSLSIPAILILTGLVGCTEPNTKWTKAYCDDNGCFQCTGDDCSPIANPSCEGDGECGGGESCTNIGCAKVCGDGGEVCATGETCIDGFCAPLGFGRVIPTPSVMPCTSDEACPEDSFCADGGKCVPRCKSDDECGPGNVCIPCGKCQPKEEPATCGTAPTFCSAEKACGEGKQCKDKRCHMTCTAGDDATQCPVGQVCDTGLCVEDPAPAKPECALDVQCDGGVCINGYCHARCEASGQCPGVGSLCQVGVCRPDYNPVN